MSILSQFKQSQNTDFPNVRPSLDLRFALAKKLDPRITFTRGSTGTYFGSDGIMRTAGVNEPRFDHDPVTGQSLGLLIEESRSNIFTYSDDAATAWSIKSGLTVSANTDIAPDGNQTMDTLVEDAARNDKYLERQITVNANQNITWSCYVKPLRRTNIFLVIYDGASYNNNVQFRYEFSNQTLSFSGAFGTGTFGSYSVVYVGNGVYRMVVSGQPTTSASTSVKIRIGFVNQSTTYLGTGVSAGAVWGAQLETGALPTSYISTTASTVTRSNDFAWMTGTNFSSWYNQSEGTIYLETDKLYPGNFDAYRHYYKIDSGSNADQITAYTLPGATAITNYGIVNGGRAVTNYQQINIGSSPIRYKLGQSVSSKYFSFTTSTGRVPPQLPSRTAPDGHNLLLATNMSRLFIGNSVGGNQINSHIARFTYYPIQLTNQQLINLNS